MRNLLSANFSRLWKNKLFYFALGCMLLLSIVGGTVLYMLLVQLVFPVLA